MSERISLPKAMAIGVVCLLLSEILCLFIAFTFAALSSSFFLAKPCSVLCTTAIHVGLMIDYASKMAKRDHLQEHCFREPHQTARPLFLALAVAAPLLLLWLGLLACKLFDLGDFLPAYRLLNAHFFQAIFYITGDVQLSDLSFLRLGCCALTCLVPAITVFAAYLYKYRNCASLEVTL